MSIFSVPDVAKPGWGLEEDLNKIIRIENLKDLTNNFSQEISRVLDRFNSTSKIRLIEFDESSGVDSESRGYFKTLSQPDVIFSFILVFLTEKIASS